MLSVGSREDGRKGIGFGAGFGGRMEEDEIEEGEAFSDREDGGGIDPDVEFSYIDERIQDVLGLFRKDFEGGFLTRNLGAKVGEYGSFLPAYQRSPPMLVQPRFQQRPPNYSISSSPYNSQSEGVRQKTDTPPIVSASLKNNLISTANTLDNLGKKDVYGSKANVRESNPQGELIGRSVTCTNDKKSLKVRVKVCLENGLARNNAAIYSGLGLDISPSQSLEENLDGSPGSSPESRDKPTDSPMTIYQFYTCFRGPSVSPYLLSPIMGTLLHLLDKDKSHPKDCELGGSGFNYGSSAMQVEEVLPRVNVKSYSGNTTASAGKKVKPIDSRGSNWREGVSNTSAMLKKEVDIEIPAGREPVPNPITVSVPPNSEKADHDTEYLSGKEAAKSKGLSRDFDRTLEKNKYLSSDAVIEEQVKSILGLETARASSSKTETSHIKTKLSLKSKAADKSLVEQRTSLKINDINGTQNGYKDDVDKDGSSIKSESEGYRGSSDHFEGTAVSVKLKAPQIGSILNPKGEKVLQEKDKTSSSKKTKGVQANDTPSRKFIKDFPVGDVAVVKKEKKNLHAKAELLDSTSNPSKPQKETNKMFNRESYSGTAGHIMIQEADERTDKAGVLAKDMAKVVKHEFKNDASLLTHKIMEKPESKNTESLPTELLEKVSNGNGTTTGAVAQPSAPLVIEKWVGCDACRKWRLLPYGMNPDHLPTKWLCSMLDWLPGMNRCDIGEEETTKALHTLYQLPITDGHGNTVNPAATHRESQDLYKNSDSMHIVRGVAKKNCSLKDVPNGARQASHFQLSSARENQQVGGAAGAPAYQSQHASESIIPIKDGQQYSDRLADLTAENSNGKDKEKKKKSKHFSDGGFLVEQGSKPSKSKKVREGEGDTIRTSKKAKCRESKFAEEAVYSDHVLNGKHVTNVANGIPSKKGGKHSLKHSESSGSKGSKYDHKERSLPMEKKMKTPVHATENGEVKHLSSSELQKSSISRKRKMDSQENEAYCQTTKFDLKEETSESGGRKVKRSRASKMDAKESNSSKMEVMLESNGKTSQVLMPCVKGQLVSEVEGYGLNTVRENQQVQRDFAGDSSKRDTGYCQPLAAATSSSSKVSGSHRSKVNIQETRDSPVESVSSSPMRICTIDLMTKRTTTGKVNATAVGEVHGACDTLGAKQEKFASTIPNRSLEINNALESNALGPTRGVCDSQVRKANQMGATTKAKDLLISELFGHTDDEPSPTAREGKNRGDATVITSDQQNKRKTELCGKEVGPDPTNGRNCVKKCGKSSSLSGEKKRNPNADRSKKKASELSHNQDNLYPMSSDNIKYDVAVGSSNHSANDQGHKDNLFNKNESRHYTVKSGINRSSEVASNSRLQGNVEDHATLLLAGKIRNLRNGESASKSYLQGNIHNASSQEEEKMSNHFSMDRHDKSELSPHNTEKVDIQNRASCPVPVPAKGSRFDVTTAKEANGSMDKVVKHHPKTETHKGPHRNSSSHLTPNRLDGPGLQRKEGGLSAAIVLKEAIDLKHIANRLKSEGLQHESTGLYFQAALKFLHVALLRELSSSDGTKHGAITQAIQMYSQTAELCEFCALEYEKHKEMAAASLAYKCMEVAYMKVVYSKHSFASKDLHELQIAPQTALHGESPSSSASDVDNLNINSGMVDKMVSAKRINSPQIAGHLIAARNRTNFVRLLTFAKNVNSAMEASRKSLSSFAAASNSHGGAEDSEAMLSVKRVLHFSFHDVEGLLRLVRLSVESLSG